MYDDDSSSDLNDESTIDLAGNCNVLDTELVGPIVDQTPPEVSLELDTNSNYSAGSKNNSHASSAHTIFIIATIKDMNLLDSETVSLSSNYNAVILVPTEIFAKLSGATDNTCTVTIGDPYDVVYADDISSMDSFKQKITLTNVIFLYKKLNKNNKKTACSRR